MNTVPAVQTNHKHDVVTIRESRRLFVANEKLERENAALKDRVSDLEVRADDDPDNTLTFKVTIVWGEDDNETGVYEFATSAERESFLLGVDASSGWMTYSVDDCNCSPPLTAAELDALTQEGC
jgi:hypothetical protein